MRKLIGATLRDYHSKIDKQFWEKHFYNENDERIFARNLPRGMHVELEAATSQYALARIDINKREDLYHWYKWSLYYFMKAKFYIRNFFRLIHS